MLRTSMVGVWSIPLLALTACVADGVAPADIPDTPTITFSAGPSKPQAGLRGASQVVRFTLGARGPVRVYDSVGVDFAPPGVTTWTRAGVMRPVDLGLSRAEYRSAIRYPVLGRVDLRLTGFREGYQPELLSKSSAVETVRQEYLVSGKPWMEAFEPRPIISMPGDDVTVTFYVTQDSPGGTDRVPVSGLSGVTVDCIGPAPSEAATRVNASEVAPGAYSAVCKPSAAGWWTVTANLGGGTGSAWFAVGDDAAVEKAPLPLSWIEGY